jgi:hypothetical protein
MINVPVTLPRMAVLLSLAVSPGACLTPPGPKRVGGDLDDPRAAPAPRAPAPRAPTARPAATPAPDAPIVMADESTGQAGTASAEPVPLPVRPAVDDETPRAQRPVVDDETPRVRPRVYGDARSVPRPTVRPGSGFGVEAGVAFGGEELVRVDFANGASKSIHAGDGVFVLATGSWTGLWIEEFLGIGVAASAGVKVEQVSASNGHIRFTRFPVAVALQVLVQTSERWFVLVRSGLVQDVGGNLSGDGLASNLNVDFGGGAGTFGDFGLFRAVGHGGFALLVRYTLLDYKVNSMTVGGDSVALAFGWYYSL